MKKNLYSTIFLVSLIIFSAAAQDGRLQATYYGNSGNEGALTVATDAAGNVYMAGITSSLGMASGGFQMTHGGGIVDAYLVKFNASGGRAWSTYYGGNDDEMTFFGGKMGIATDDNGNVYMAGLTRSTTNIWSTGAFDTAFGGGMDAYLVKFDSTGARKWGTYYGGSDVDYGYSVAVDKSGNVYLCGITGTTTGIASGGFQNTIGGGGDAFLAKFDAAGNRIWSTYYGGAAEDAGYSVATDESGNVFLAGTTYSTTGISSGGFQNNFGGGAFDAFLVMFDSSGARRWATYYGGSGDEMMPFAGDLDVAADKDGNVFLTGLTTSSAAIASGGFQNTFGGGTSDGFLVKFNSAGVRQWATYYGGSDEDKCYNVATDDVGDVYIAGRTYSASGISSGGFQNNYNADLEAFLAKFTPDGTRLCATYYGGNAFDSGDGLDIDKQRNIYMSGNTATTTGMASGGFQNFFGGGGSDAYLVKFRSCASTTGVDEKFSEENEVFAFPNPARTQLAVGNLELAIERIEIYNLIGEKILSLKNTSVVDVSAFQKGIYLMKIIFETSSGEKSISEKIIVE